MQIQNGLRLRLATRLLVAGALLVVVLLLPGALRAAYQRIGLGLRAAMLLLLASLVGSYFNLSVARSVNAMRPRPLQINGTQIPPR